MKRTGNQISELQIAYIGGGSRNWAWNLMSDLALEEQLSGKVLLYDINFDAAMANEIIGNSIESKNPWRYQAVDRLETALTGADFVVISILPATLKEMALDIELPEKYGIYQSVGDTVGPGGALRAMRTLPMYHVIAEAIKAHCPDAWVINYTNPMTVCVGYMKKVWPQMKVFGCCHELFGLQKSLATLVNRAGLSDMPATYQDIYTNPLGINHFTWVDRATYKGMDVIPLFAKAAEDYFETGDRLVAKEAEEGGDPHFQCLNKVKFDLYKRFGIIPAGGDRHLAEFCPQWYLKSRENVSRWGFMLTPISHRYHMAAQRKAESQAITSGQTKFVVEASGEDEISQMKALLGLRDFVTNVNIPNHGQIQNLPEGSVVECNVLFHQNAIDPMVGGRIPENLNALIYRHVVNQNMMVDATYEKNIEKAFEAFCNDPLMDVTRDNARALFEEMVAGTRDYLDWWF